MRINLGCGADIKKDYINYDKFPVNDNVKFLDLEILPLPFKDESVEEIFMEDTFEHLNVNRFDLMKEFFRILKPNGKIRIIVPSNTNSVSHTISYFEQDYFEILKGKRNIVNEKYYNMFFGSVRVFKRYRPIKNIIYKIRNFIGLFIHSSYEFEIKK